MKHLKTSIIQMLVIFIISLSISSCSQKAYGCYDFGYNEKPTENPITCEQNDKHHLFISPLN